MSKHRLSGRVASRMAISAMLLLFVSGCLQPVNGVRLGSAGDSTLSDVSVGRVEGYMGYILKSELDFLLSEGKAGKSGRYLLNIQAREVQDTPIVDSTTGRIQVANLLVQAVYELKDLQTNKFVTSGRTFASASYDRSTQRFSAERAKRDAQERVGKALAERLRAIIITALADGSDTKAGAMPVLSRSILEEIQQNTTAEPGDEN